MVLTERCTKFRRKTRAAGRAVAILDREPPCERGSELALSYRYLSGLQMLNLWELFQKNVASKTVCAQ